MNNHLIRKILFISIFFSSVPALAQNYESFQADQVERVKEDLRPALETIKQITVAANCGFAEERNAGAAIYQIQFEMSKIILPARVGPEHGIDIRKMTTDAIAKGQKMATKEFCQSTKPAWRSRIIETIHLLIQAYGR